MIKCKCINAKNKPLIIPEEKWLEEGKTYHVTHVAYCTISKKVGVRLYEIDIDIKHYKYFAIERFGFDAADLPSLIELAKYCSELNNADISELTEVLEKELV